MFSLIKDWREQRILDNSEFTHATGYKRPSGL